MSEFVLRDFGQAVRRALPGATGIIAGFVLNAALVSGQTPPTGAQEAPEQKTLMAEDVFHNVQVLKGISVNEFMETMGFFCASLAMTCTDCHGDASASDWNNYAADFPLKQMARRMVVMVNGINSANFAGAR